MIEAHLTVLTASGHTAICFVLLQAGQQVVQQVNNATNGGQQSLQMLWHLHATRS